jgi:hypothetical protein
MQELPCEILQPLTSSLAAFEIGRLWLCGCKRLNWKLSKGGALTSFKFFSNSYHPLSWPNLISQFERLENFSLTIHEYGAFYPAFELQLHKLPRNLKHIKLSCPLSSHFLHNAFTSDPDLFQSVESLTLSGKDFDSELPPCLYLPWTNLMSVNGGDYHNYKRQLVLSKIPKTITSLSVSASQLDFSEEGRFPDSLTTLLLELGSPCDILPCLPLTLTQLELTATNETMPFEKLNWEQLPPALTLLTIETREFTKEHAKALPRSLIKLSLVGIVKRTLEIVKDLLPYLPSSITSLTGIWPSPICSELASILPRNLIQRINDDLEWDAVQYLPPGITSIRLRYETNTPPIIPGSFPPKLTSFSSEYLTDEIAAKLPSGLKSLSVDMGEISLVSTKLLPRQLSSIISMRRNGFETLECWKHLPPTMTSLDVIPISSSSSRTSYPNPTEAPLDSAGWLPRNLISVTLGPLIIANSTWFLHLPSKLTYIKIALLAEPLGGLKHLYTTCTKLTTVEIRCSTVPPRESWDHILQDMPKTLLSFVWSQSNESRLANIPESALSKLPPAMTSLSLPDCATITSACLSYFPVTMRSFSHGDTPGWFHSNLQAQLNARSAHYTILAKTKNTSE